MSTKNAALPMPIICKSLDGFAVRTSKRCIWESVCRDTDIQAGIKRLPETEEEGKG